MHPSRLMSAELVPDGGSSAVGPEFFRSAEFLRAEGVTHSLVVDGGRVVVPLVRRDVPGGGHDAISPYGYPGGSLRGEPPHVDQIDFTGLDLISIFIRERLGVPALRGGEVRSPVLVHDPGRPRQVNARVATKVRSNERRGYRFEAIPAAAVDAGLLQSFDAAYRATMYRADAAERYFFSDAYFRACLASDGSWLAVVRGPEGDLAAGAIVVLSDGHLHYYLGGTADAHRGVGPSKNMMVGMLDLADSLGVPLSLGGGMSGVDNLHAFKLKFTNSSADFVTHAIVCDPDEYARLTAGSAPTTFFPAYRALARVGV